ncbi:hypothetical protein DCAR_0832410 [Daucus carota subsp. sativus]|uniref:Peptidase C19 ubiquitin carboxyl-terminal hydrolase domain-containing protein n=1 Tax=Daucus carota subsp. sativus TaxID=79200 RepID=A0AAF0XV02_DAUCS|nr:hypothetical protein DCAR_0832410 [Daucus carota subsp. sativus]
MFKAVIASSHPEFSTMRQQDAFEFFLHFIDQVEVLNAGNPQLDPSRCFKFGIEERLQCPSGKVAYNSRQDCILSLNIPLDRAINRSRLLEILLFILLFTRSLEGIYTDHVHIHDILKHESIEELACYLALLQRELVLLIAFDNSSTKAPDYLRIRSLLLFESFHHRLQQQIKPIKHFILIYIIDTLVTVTFLAFLSNIDNQSLHLRFVNETMSTPASNGKKLIKKQPYK